MEATLKVAVDSFQTSSQLGAQHWVCILSLGFKPRLLQTSLCWDGAELSIISWGPLTDFVSVAFRPLPEVCGGDDEIQRGSGGLP